MKLNIDELESEDILKNNMLLFDEENIRDNFYFLCQDNNKSKQINDLFSNNEIRKNLSYEVLEIGLMGCARTNQIENSKTIFKNLNESDLENLRLSAMINMSLKKSNYEFLNELYHLNEWNFLFKDNKIKNIKLRGKKINSITNIDIIGNKYNKFNINPLIFFKDKKEELAYVLEKELSINKIVNAFVNLSMYNDDYPLNLFLSILESKYFKELIKNEEFNYYLNNNNKYKDDIVKIINIYNLTENLEEKLNIKNIKENRNKI